MKTLTTEQFNALPEERRKYWKEQSIQYRNPGYEQVLIPLEDAERVLEEIAEKIQINHPNFVTAKYVNRYLTTAINNLKQLTK